MGQVFKTAECHSDLVGIGRHIARDNPVAAIKMLETIDAKLQFLAENPLLGEARPELAPDMRSFSVRNYVIYFQPCAGGIDVVRVLHGAQDINMIL